MRSVAIAADLYRERRYGQEEDIEYPAEIDEIPPEVASQVAR